MFKALAAVAFSLLAFSPASAVDDSYLIAAASPPTAVILGLSVQEMGDGIAAERAGFAMVDVQVTGSVDQAPVVFTGDGIAAERAQLAAAFDTQHFLANEPETLALIEAELASLREPTVTGSLALMPWEAEEPALMKAYVAGRAAYEAMLTP